MGTPEIPGNAVEKRNQGKSFPGTVVASRSVAKGEFVNVLARGLEVCKGRGLCLPPQATGGGK